MLEAKPLTFLWKYWNCLKWARPALRCLDITCLCILSFLPNDFSQTEQSQLMSTPQEQNVDWEKVRMLHIVFPSSFSSSSSSSSSLFYCFLSFAHSSHFFSPQDSIKDCPLHFEALSRVVNNNRGFLQLLADCPVYQRQFLSKTATPQQLHALVQVL